jgi:hypothetical protein
VRNARYAAQPTVTKLAEDRAEQPKRDPDKVAQELEDRLRADLRKTGDFSRIHPLPRSGADVPDDLETRLVVLSAEHPYGKEPSSPAEVAAKAILASRGSAPRLYQNTLVFLAADRVRLEDLDEALRKFLAWESIVADTNTLNLDPRQVRQAETQKQAAAFAYAESFDEAASRYRGLECGQVVAVPAESTGLLVKADVARKEIDEETQAAAAAAAATGAGSASASGTAGSAVAGQASSSAPGASPAPATLPTGPVPPRRYHGTVRLDPARAGRDASRIADEVIAHLAGLQGATVTVTLEIEATIPGGASEQLVRTVTENGRTLKFESFGFEEE